MSIPLVIANLLCLLAFGAHTFIGDKEMRSLEPEEAEGAKRQFWTQARAGWHMVSFDLLFATIALALINFNDWIKDETFLLQILMIYFIGYGVFWLMGLLISKSFLKNYLKLGQWALLWVIAALVWWGI
ncbi:MAG: hypothetical protein AAGD28_28105 [Bacteroidota bacterium]